jgi:hypothetical protein
MQHFYWGGGGKLFGTFISAFSPADDILGPTLTHLV